MNSAERLFRVYDDFVKHRLPQTPMSQVWAEVFALPKDDPDLEDDVNGCLVALRSEVDFAAERLEVHGVPPNLLHPAFSQLKNVASTAHIHSAWESYRDRIQSPEHRKILEWACWALRDEAEADMADQDLAELRAELEALEGRLKEADLSPYLRSFVQRQVNTMRSALRVYGVQGLQPVHEAFEKVTGAYAAAHPRLDVEFSAASETGKGAVKNVGDTLRRISETCGQLDKVVGFTERVWKITAAAGPALIAWTSGG